MYIYNYIWPRMNELIWKNFFCAEKWWNVFQIVRIGTLNFFRFFGSLVLKLQGSEVKKNSIFSRIPAFYGRYSFSGMHFYENSSKELLFQRIQNIWKKFFQIFSVNIWTVLYRLNTSFWKKRMTDPFEKSEKIHRRVFTCFKHILKFSGCAEHLAPR